MRVHSRRSTRLLWTTIGLSVVVVGGIAVGMSVPQGGIEAVRADNAVGDSTCLSCHRDKATFEQTAHRLTSRRPSREAIAGSFRDGENVLRTSNPELYFRMTATDTGFFEVAVIGRPPDTSVRSERIAFVTGSGRKGQSYLYWEGDELYQLPVSYWRGVGWANSPAYPDGRPNFERPIYPRCLECHTSGFRPVSGAGGPNRYRRTGVMLGITCETCHGSGETHVRRQRSPLRLLLPPAIANPAELPRARRLDGCGLCHGQVAAPRTPAFAYVPGQPLEPAFDPWASPDTGTIDVHGNQVAQLERSRCFTESHMTCGTCHDVHREQRDVREFSDRCLTCHTPQGCGLFQRHGNALVGRCVDCHMPALTSSRVVSNHPDQQVRVQVRAHWIKVYPQFQQP